MYNHITGTIREKKPTSVVVEAAGVGYFLHIPLSTFERIASEDKATLFTHLSVTQDNMRLFGFATIDERDLFRLLLGVSGVGPMVALAVLSGISVPGVVAAVERNEPKMIQRVKGVGKKTSEKIIIDLKDKLTAFAPAPTIDEEDVDAELHRDAALALVSLGYSQPAAEAAVAKAAKGFDEAPEVQDLIKAALQHI